jgi:hypothetical protein
MQERKTFCLADTWHWQQFETGPDHADYAVEDLRGAGREADNDAGGAGSVIQRPNFPPPPLAPRWSPLPGLGNRLIEALALIRWWASC